MAAPLLSLATLLFAASPLSAQAVRTIAPEEAAFDTLSAVARTALGDSISNPTGAGRAPNWLGQAGFTGGDGTAAIQVQVLKFFLEWREGSYLPLYVLGGLPVSSSTDIGDVTSAILDEYGGSVNFTIGSGILKAGGPRGLFSFPSDPELGLRFEGRTGVKVMDLGPAIDDQKTDFAVLALGTATMRLTLPVLTKTDNSDFERAGSLELGLSASYQWSNADSYLTLFDEADLLQKGLWYLNASASFIVTDVIYISGRITLATQEDRLDQRATFSINVLKGN